MSGRDLMLEAAQDLEDLDLPRGASFEMEAWGKHPDGKKPTLDNLCRTSACAAGWLSLMPKWRERGFKSEWKLNRMYNRWELHADNGERGWEEMTNAVFGEEASRFMISIFGCTWKDREGVIANIRDAANGLPD